MALHSEIEPLARDVTGSNADQRSIEEEKGLDLITISADG